MHSFRFTKQITRKGISYRNKYST